MVTPTNGTVLMRGLRGSPTTLNVYLSDVAGAAWTISRNGSAVAGSPTSYLTQADAWIEDISIVSGPTVSLSSNIYFNGVPTGQVIQLQNFYSTLNNRPRNIVFVPRNTTLAFYQV